MLWIYDIPTPLFGLLCVVAFAILGIVGYYVTKPIVRMLMGPPPGHNEGVDVIIGAVTLLYGLILALIAVAVWEQFSTADTTVSQEASTLRSLYRDVEMYPEPDRSTLTTPLRDYTKNVIDNEWPAQQRGIVPSTNDQISAFETALYAFNPKSEGEKLIHESTIGEFNKLVELRNQRLHTVTQGIPSSLWAIILIGAVLTIVSTYFLQLERVRAQLTMTSFISVLIAIVIFITAVMDHPFRGGFSVGSDAFQTTYDRMTGH
ncbi:DUF4239 domain-containing protein [Mycobacterium sp.]|uniref:bestrophin-like domain n=1 Tax=Mycobacterium sp. TaxID=1785 RepID=UPI002C3EAB46|nr:DUF4239 domain-containing protein [Mycobacterium sp.]HME49298.1 DUF4239 domain-containing protein [Mycobacterium sp.]